MISVRPPSVDAASFHSLTRWIEPVSYTHLDVYKRQAQANAHDVNSAWWRVEGIVDPAQWSDDATWHARCDPPDRWRSTNHLCGPGYWVWMIPLASNAHSIGIVADEALHPLATINRHDKAMAWLRDHQPRLATLLERPEHCLLYTSRCV